jgi:hypothetical protein
LPPLIHYHSNSLPTGGRPIRPGRCRVDFSHLTYQPTAVSYRSHLFTRQSEPWLPSFDRARPHILSDEFRCRITLKLPTGQQPPVGSYAKPFELFDPGPDNLWDLDIVIPAGTGTDFASYRWWMLPGLLLPRKCEVAQPSVLHDYLIRTRFLEQRLGLSPWEADQMADAIYWLGQPWIGDLGRRVGYDGVRVGSWLRAVDRSLGTELVTNATRPADEPKRRTRPKRWIWPPQNEPL